MISEEVQRITEILNNEFLWIYFLVVFIIFYILVSLLTWNIRKPLLFLGIPSIIGGIVVIILSFIIPLLFTGNELLPIIKTSVNPLLKIGIIVSILGIIMILLYKVLNNVFKNKNINV